MRARSWSTFTRLQQRIEFDSESNAILPGSNLTLQDPEAVLSATRLSEVSITVKFWHCMITAPVLRNPRIASI